ncbi:MAG: hypothetical protein V3S16_01400 [Candidatus Desulfatibia sp.]|uniref:hypothetical protein n=1 Tax=Candidatus Desulfatibia sp. TaxID=3101189 RepID=UPI002F31EFDA
MSLNSAENYFVDEMVNHGFSLLRLVGGVKRGHKIFKNFIVPGPGYGGITVIDGRFSVKVQFPQLGDSIKPISRKAYRAAL